MYYIGIDLGTSALKTLLMDSEGAVLNIASREYPLEFPHPGWSQQKPEDWQKAVFACIPELTKDIDRSQVAGIGVGGQMHGLVVLDNNAYVILPMGRLLLQGSTVAKKPFISRERCNATYWLCYNYAIF